MKYEKRIELGDGRICILRSVRLEDAPKMITYLRETAGETRFLLREAEEVKITLEQEEEFIRKSMDSERDALLIAEINGEHVGNCSFSGYQVMRCRHRCSIGIALYQKWCGQGIGRKMLEALLTLAAECGYEQAELEVVADNERAIRLYESLGFERYGTRPYTMKYKDGTYSGEHLMVKKLV